MRIRSLLPLYVALLLALVLAPATRAQAPPRGGADRITTAELREYLTYVASDELAGRETPSPGLDAAAKYLAEHLARWGVKLGGEKGTYFQAIRLRRSRPNPALTKVALNGTAFAAGDDFLPGRGAGNASGQLVYAGNGYVVKAKGLNSYAGLTVKDRILIVSGGRSGLPKGIETADLRGKEGEDWDTPTTYARRNGARGIVYVPDFAMLANWADARREPPREGYQVEKFAGPTPPLPSITAAPRLLAALFQGEKASAAEALAKALNREGAESFALGESKTLSFAIAVDDEYATTQNVIGVLEGSDPLLKNEYVALGAHYDHVGARPAVPGQDTIYNGADDDGSGTVAVLAIAEAFARGPRPRRRGSGVPATSPSTPPCRSTASSPS